MVDFKVKGMVCTGCEKRVCNVLALVDGVDEVKASYETGIVTIKTSKDIDKSLIIKKIEDLGFEVI